MKRGIEERGPIAAWLIRARGSFRKPDAKRTWTVDDFLGELEAAVNWSPVRTTYARWESGATRPDDANLQRVIDFYAARGVPGPDPIPDLATALLALAQSNGALAHELAETRREREEYRTRLDALDAAVAELVARSNPHDEGHPGAIAPGARSLSAG